MSKRMTWGQLLSNAADSVGLIMATHSPGDGVTRYRFFRIDELKRRGYDPEKQSYYGPAEGAYTALGRKEAITYLRGAGAYL